MQYVLKPKTSEVIPLDKPQRIIRYLKATIGFSRKERFFCLFLDIACRLIRMEEMFVGTENNVSVSIKEIATNCLIICGSSKIIVAHNHPNGKETPSLQDIALTEKLENTLKILDIEPVDHLTITFLLPNTNR
jgi:DNA repair protein RadC